MNPADLVAIATGPMGKEYVLSLIRMSPGLTEAMSTIIAHSGSCYAILPRETTRDRALSFRAGGITDEGDVVTRLQEKLDGRAAENRSGVVIVEELHLSASHYVKSLPQPHWFVSNETMHVWASFGPSEALDLDALLAQTYGFNCPVFVVEDGHLAEDLKRGDVDLPRIAQHVTEVFAPAYDEESFVVWER